MRNEWWSLGDLRQAVGVALGVAVKLLGEANRRAGGAGHGCPAPLSSGALGERLEAGGARPV